MITFKKGGRIEAAVSRAGDTLHLETPDGSYEFLASEIADVVPVADPQRDWPARRERALAGGAGARCGAARWALENGLTEEAAAMVRAAWAADPEHGPSRRMKAALDRLAAPCADPEFGALLRALGHSARVARGPHTLLVHRHEDKDAGERIGLLERVVTSYYLDLADRGLELPAPRFRLASAWFPQRSEYLGFLKNEGAGAFLTTRGYFSPALDAVVAYDARSDERQKAGRSALAEMRRQLDRLEEAIERTPRNGRLRIGVAGEESRSVAPAAARSLLAGWRRDASRREILLNQEYRALDFGTAAHEMVHQLVVASGLAPHHEDFPIWLHEGLATQFEVFRGGRWAGIGQPHPIRLADWRAIEPPPRLLPLVRDVGMGHGYDRDLYAQAWALVYFLQRERRRDYLTFLDLLRVPSSDSAPRPDRTQAAFEASFGHDFERLQTEWLRSTAAAAASSTRP